MDYTGLWTSASTLAITLTNDTCCTDAQLGETTVSLVDKLGRLVRNAGGNSAAARGAALLSGSFGEAERAPQISAFYLEVCHQPWP